jgi:alkaline phosphatase D
MFTRRRFLTTAASAALLGAPSISRANDRPVVTHGVQSGDVTMQSGVVWGRADRPSRMLVEVSTTESFRDIRHAVFVDALPESDFTAKALIDDLPAGQDIFYRIAFQNLFSPMVVGEPSVGRFRTAPSDRRSISFIWSGDQAGQGWGIDVARGGMKTYATMQRNRPDFLIHSGDHIYADYTIKPEVTLPNGEVWKNIVTEEKTRIAETLADFRGNWRYNLLDANLLAFNREIPTISQWDDHEVLNNWWPHEPLTRGEHKRRGFREPNTLVLAARASRAMHEYLPMVDEPAEPGRVYRKISYGPLLDVFMLDMRSYRGPNAENMEESYGPSAYFLGPAQVAWLKRGLRNSRATWKVLANDIPLALLRIHDSELRWGHEGMGQGDPGPPRGRELELADILSFIKRENIRNTVWLTADVHYTAAHYFDPNQAAFQDFDPFWEFVSGPIHANTGRPGPIDKTFGPQVVYAKGLPRDDRSVIGAPSDGLQFFGHVAIDGATQVMTVTLKDVADTALWATRIEPKFT